MRNQEKAERLFGDLLKREDLKLVIGDITMPVEVEDKIDISSTVRVSRLLNHDQQTGGRDPDVS